MELQAHLSVVHIQYTQTTTTVLVPPFNFFSCPFNFTADLFKNLRHVCADTILCYPPLNHLKPAFNSFQRTFNLRRNGLTFPFQRVHFHCSVAYRDAYADKRPLLPFLWQEIRFRSHITSAVVSGDILTRFWRVFECQSGPHCLS